MSNLTKKMVEEIALDFIVTDMPISDIKKKYNISDALFSTICNRMALHKKRDSYRNKVLAKSLERCSTYQSKIIYKATEILNTHIEKLSVRQRQQKDQILSSSEIRDVMSILQIVSKEHKLDNDKPTDKIIKEVRVLFPEGFVPITSKPDVIVEATEVKVEEEPVEEIEIKTDILKSPL